MTVFPMCVKLMSSIDVCCLNRVHIVAGSPTSLFWDIPWNYVHEIILPEEGTPVDFVCAVSIGCCRCRPVSLGGLNRRMDVDFYY